MSEERIVAIEEKIAHQEHTVQTLNETVYAQQRQLDQLRSEVLELALQLRSLSESIHAPGDGKEPPPPHY